MAYVILHPAGSQALLHKQPSQNPHAVSHVSSEPAGCLGQQAHCWPTADQLTSPNQMIEDIESGKLRLGLSLVVIPNWRKHANKGNQVIKHTEKETRVGGEFPMFSAHFPPDCLLLLSQQTASSFTAERSRAYLAGAD